MDILLKNHLLINGLIDNSSTGNSNIENPDVLTFLNNAVSKSKILNQNKLQIELQKCINEVNQYKLDNETFKNKIEELTKEKNGFIELNEKYKSDLHKCNLKNEELDTELNHHKNVLIHEKNINQNLKTVHDAQLLKLNKTNEDLCNKVDDHFKKHVELNTKHDELHQRYKDLTILYSKQTNELEISRKELKHLKDELSTACLNNSNLYDEIQYIKKQTVEHLDNIKELKRLNELNVPIQSLPVVSSPVSMTKPPSKITSRRGLKVTER